MLLHLQIFWVLRNQCCPSLPLWRTRTVRLLRLRSMSVILRSIAPSITVSSCLKRLRTSSQRGCNTMDARLIKQSEETRSLIAEARQTGDFKKVLEALEATRQLVKKLGEKEIESMEQEINLRF